VSWLLDTNVLSEPLKRRPAVHVLNWVAGQPIDTLYTTSLAFAEIQVGIADLLDSPRKRELSLWLDQRIRPFFGTRVVEADEQVWVSLLKLVRAAKSVGRTLANADAIFAAIADRYDLVLVTRNVKHLIGTGVRILDPWQAAPSIVTAR
jgi:predicted nucleic acid-binding protein